MIPKKIHILWLLTKFLFAKQAADRCHFHICGKKTPSHTRCSKKTRFYLSRELK